MTITEGVREGARVCAGGGEGGLVVHGWGARRCVREGLSACERDGVGKRCVRGQRSECVGTGGEGVRAQVKEGEACTDEEGGGVHG